MKFDFHIEDGKVFTYKIKMKKGKKKSGFIVKEKIKVGLRS